MSDVNDGSKYPEGTLSEDGHMVVRGGEWAETELGQHDRWLRQAPDLFGLYQAALEVVARHAQEIQDLRSQSVMALAKHYGCGEQVSFSDAWRWLAERVEMVRVGQKELETFKSSAETALGAFVDRIKALQSEIQDLRNLVAIKQQMIDEAVADVRKHNGYYKKQFDRRVAVEFSRDALREALKELRAVVMGECPSLLNEDSGGDARLALQIDQLLAETPTEDQ